MSANSALLPNLTVAQVEGSTRVVVLPTGEPTNRALMQALCADETVVAAMPSRDIEYRLSSGEDIGHLIT
ncbi:hypothetical protein GGS21DRAFT_490598 [Xylaria nigripes]|nr:hypothetical protein GGS21DRAFT_490598 [Xylaria nigripes]